MFAIEPLISREPVNLCVSSIVSPKIVEPLENDCVMFDTVELTIYLLPIISPLALMSPSTCVCYYFTIARC